MIKKLSSSEARNAREDLRKLYALPPHDTPGNSSANDGYFAKSISARYGGMTLDELEQVTGLKEAMAKWNLAKEKADELLSEERFCQHEEWEEKQVMDFRYEKCVGCGKERKL